MGFSTSGQQAWNHSINELFQRRKLSGKEKGRRWARRPAIHSDSLRTFFRARLRANASFTRRFAPGFK